MKLPHSRPSSISYFERIEQQRKEQLEKLGSGLKINRSSDDPAGLQIANRLTSEINQTNVGIRNARDQQSIYNTQAGQYSAITDNLLRAKELTIQAGNPIYDKQAIQNELDQLSEQINVVAEQVLGQSGFISSLNASDPTASQALLDEATTEIATKTGEVGASSNASNSRINNYQVSSINTSEARSRIQDTDYAETSSEQVKAEIQLKIAVLTKKDEEERKGLLFNQFV
ncbi:flagellin [Shewanella atlantica]|uniref:Flagellin n=1 Tax=Shewanella atlantica TaxID=271099 RepID=A0A3S0K149_9GAMM|nr:flagellin [Shewanella atlantica]RTR33352.1 flagellin [Shewanella atlantica]